MVYAIYLRRGNLLINQEVGWSINLMTSHEVDFGVASAFRGFPADAVFNVMNKEDFMNGNDWSPSRQNPNNIYRPVNGVNVTVYLNKAGRYGGVRNGKHTDSFPSQRLAMSALYDLLPHTPPPPPPPPAPKPEPKPAPKKTLTEEIISAGDGDFEKGYRRLSLKYHPDAGGSHELMIALNLEIAKLRKANVN